MAELVPAPFADLVGRLLLEPSKQSTIFDLPVRSWYVPPENGADFSVTFHRHKAGNGCGPASGPHTQMAQNLVLSYIAGARIMELKTVQVNDRLNIPRPCIDMTNVGYNVEWSQELLVEQSLREYVAGMMLVHIFRHASPDAPPTLAGPAGDVIYDISLGYDLAGIKSAKIQQYLDGIRDASMLVEQLRGEIPSHFRKARDLEFPTRVADTLTLSTFHGCPTDEIERICEFLIGERDLDVIVKMNPPTIGREMMEYLLHEVMGYHEITVRPEAYSASQTFDEAVAMCARLRDFASARGRNFGCKFSNTLEVLNHREFFPPGNEVMYLSGAPLHVITLTLASMFRDAVGPAVPISFSAGIDAQNFPAAVACGFVPVTTCSDLLKTGGYGRLPDYLKNLEKAMRECGANNISEHILRVHGIEDEARTLAGEGASHEEIIQLAGLLNNRIEVRRAQENPRYRADANRRVPKRVESHLVIFDCLTCDKCVPVCPNDANFIYPLDNARFNLCDYEVNGESTIELNHREFNIEKKHQIANYAEYCNECGNCDTFCPEYGGPFIEKPSFYRTEESFRAAAPRDGFVVTPGAITGRIRGAEYTLKFGESAHHHFIGLGFEALVTSDHRLARATVHNGKAHIDMGIYHTLRLLHSGVMDDSRLNQINVANYSPRNLSV